MSGSGLGQIDGSGVGGGGGNSSKHLLEIEVVGLKRRLWAAESKQECRRWVSSQHAMNEVVFVVVVQVAAAVFVWWF